MAASSNDKVRANARTGYHSKASQVAARIRENLILGHWPQGLPAERQLAAAMSVGRMTLRAALTELRHEGILKDDGRKRAKRKSLVIRTRSIGMVVPSRLSGMETNNLLFVDELRRLVYGAGFTFNLYESTSASPGRLFAFLRRIAKNARHDCWILLTSTPEIQAWCAASGLPVVLAATNYQGITLPSVDVDHRALCRHAVGEMIRRNHKELAILLPKNELAGDVESRLGFIQGVHDARNRGVASTIHYHNETVGGICKAVDHLYGLHPQPTAWIVCRAESFLTVFSHLLNRNIRVPGEISLVSRDSEVLLQHLVPKPACYVYDSYVLAKRVWSFALKVANGQNLTGRHLLTMPEFLPGATLGPGPGLR